VLLASEVVFVVPVLVPVTRTVTHLPFCADASLSVLLVAPDIFEQLLGIVDLAAVTAVLQAYH